MGLIPNKFKFWQVQKTQEIAQQQIPENVLGRLSGLGEPPQFGNRVTLPDIQRAYETARWGEVYWKFALFRDMIINDSHIQAEIGKRIMSFIGQHCTLEPYDKKVAADVEAKEAIEDMIANCDNWREGCLHLAGGHVWPVAAAERIYAPVDASEQFKFRHKVRYRLKKLHVVPYALLNYRVAYWNLNNSGSAPGTGPSPMPAMSNSGAIPITDGSYSGASALSGYGINYDPDVLVWNPDDWQPDLRFYNVLSNGLIDWTLANCYKADPKRHIIYSANVSTAGMRENWASVLDSLVPWWFFSTSGRDWFARAMERYGSPFSVVNANTTNKNLFDSLAKAFREATKINALIVPTQAKVELKEVQYTSMADAYAKFIEVCNVEKTKAILGQVLSTSPKNTGLGSGVADLQGEVRSEWRIYDERAFGTMERTEIFEPYLRINGFKGRAPKSIRGGLTLPNQQSLSKTIANNAQAGWVVSEESAEDLSKLFGGLKMEFVGLPKSGGDGEDDEEGGKKNVKSKKKTAHKDAD